MFMSCAHWYSYVYVYMYWYMYVVLLLVCVRVLHVQHVHEMLKLSVSEAVIFCDAVTKPGEASTTQLVSTEALHVSALRAVR